MLLFGGLRSITRPVTRALWSSSATRTVFGSGSPAQAQFQAQARLWAPPPSAAYHFLTDPRFPKRRPSLTSRRKRWTYNPPGPYRWVRPVHPDDVPPKNPNKGSVKRRNEKKRLRQKEEFIKSERNKRQVLIREATRKKLAKRVERKMAAVARERAWAIRLKELQRLDAAKKAKTA